MINVRFINWDGQSDSAEVATMDEAKRFISEYIITQPIVMDSVRVTDGTNQYTVKVTPDATCDNTTKVTWRDCTGKINEQVLRNPADTLRFIQENILCEPVVLDSVRIVKQSFKLSASLELVPAVAANG
ncbi:hypothetical protein M7775_07920 [Sporomusa sphaeroides DSM 2875]|uniref:hypothetical protein n=1 Tax=Sporomusa sphaeroides TaxID=47679 RepID=UPI00202E91F8|nr:hypothetical protein [Sporomusa sphaeroides]MCM0758496.1 hypothetical protein [Sporomusa sphaeroides DSM 2875]